MTDQGMEVRNIYRYRILLVDDSPTIWEPISAVLKRTGYEVEVAEDGIQALNAFKRTAYDLILMDIEMPNMDGHMAARAIRAFESGPGDTVDEGVVHSTGLRRIPIIAMTGYATEEMRETCSRAGFDDLISKPATMGELLAMVRKWIMAGPEPAEQPLRGLPEQPLLREDIPMNLERAIEEFDGDETLLMGVLLGFLKNLKDQIGIIRQAVLEGNAKRVQREAHSIKGGAANLTAYPLAAIASMLEKLGKSGALEGGIGMVEDLERELCRLEDYVGNP